MNMTILHPPPLRAKQNRLLSGILAKAPAVFLRDLATVQDASDIVTCFALVNGRRTVYVPVTKRADASTLSVVNLVKQNLPRFQSVLPGDVTVSYEFDQSPYVTRAIKGLTLEAALGAMLTGLVVLLFLPGLPWSAGTRHSLKRAVIKSRMKLASWRGVEPQLMSISGRIDVPGARVQALDAGFRSAHALPMRLRGSVIGALSLALSIPIVRPLVLLFGSPELFIIAIMGITFIGTLAGPSLIKGLLAGGIGLMLAAIGVDPQTGTPSTVVPDLLATYRGTDDGVMFGVNAIVVAGAGAQLQAGSPVEIELDF